MLFGGPLPLSSVIVVLIATVIAFPFTWRATGTLYAAGLHLAGLAIAVLASDFGPGVAIAVAGVALYVRSRITPLRTLASGETLRAWAIVGGGYGLYELARFLSRGSADEAMGNAHHIASFERTIGIFSEARVQRWLTANADVRDAFNLTYSHAFLAVCLGALVWTFVVDKRSYLMLRNAMGISAILTVITSGLFPLAPPRMVPDLGIADTVLRAGEPHHFANAYAAMPSLHVGWTFLSGLAIGLIAGRAWGIIVGVAAGTAMLLVVISTGNHYWLDGAVGVTYGLIGIALSNALYATQARRIRRAALPGMLHVLSGTFSGWRSHRDDASVR